MHRRVCITSQIHVPHRKEVQEHLELLNLHGPENSALEGSPKMNKNDTDCIPHSEQIAGIVSTNLPMSVYQVVF